MSFHIYILQCADGSYYTGHTDNLESRLAAHESGAVAGYTRSRRPVSLVFSDSFTTRADALERERQIKRWSRRKKQALIDGDWALLQTLARQGGSTSSPRTDVGET
jgi:tRNA/rRNA methyltransferase